MSLLEAGDFAPATVPLSKAARLAPEKSSIREALGRAYFRSRRYAEAAREFEAVVERYPVNDFAHFCLGRALTLTGQRDRARRHLAIAANLRPERDDYRIYRQRLAAEPVAAARRMRALVQRVSRASVSVEGRQVAAIGPGLLVLLGVAPEDTEAEADRLADKVRALRIFDDADGRMNEPLADREVLCVSQFTLYADTRKGNRPGFTARRTAGGGRAPVRALLRAPGRKARGCSAPGWRSSWSTTGP